MLELLICTASVRTRTRASVFSFGHSQSSYLVEINLAGSDQEATGGSSASRQCSDQTLTPTPPQDGTKRRKIYKKEKKSFFFL